LEVASERLLDCVLNSVISLHKVVSLYHSINQLTLSKKYQALELLFFS
jgi:hypothetical protein